MLGRNAAADVIEKYGTADLKSIVYGEGFKVKVMHPWHSSYEDVYAHPLIFVPRDGFSARFT